MVTARNICRSVEKIPQRIKSDMRETFREISRRDARGELNEGGLRYPIGRGGPEKEKVGRYNFQGGGP